MLYQYSPTGQYLAGNTILSPHIIDQINYTDYQPNNKGKGNKFIFNSIDFSYFDKDQNRQIRITPSFAAYEQFYKNVAANKSLMNVPEQVEKDFTLDHPSTLMITMRTDSSNSTQIIKGFQMIQLIETDYFRVQLYGKPTDSEWAYFYQPHVYQETLKLFTHPN